MHEGVSQLSSDIAAFARPYLAMQVQSILVGWTIQVGPHKLPDQNVCRALRGSDDEIPFPHVQDKILNLLNARAGDELGTAGRSAQERAKCRRIASIG